MEETRFLAQKLVEPFLLRRGIRRDGSRFGNAKSCFGEVFFDVASRGGLAMLENAGGALGDWRTTSLALEIDERFRCRLVGVIRRHRAAVLKSQIDSEGVANAAICTYVMGRGGKFSRSVDGRHTWRLLVTLALRALNDEIKREHAAKRDYTRKLGQETGNWGDCFEQLADANAGDPAESIAVMEELRAVAGVVHPKAVEIIEYSLDGLTNQEIATKVGLGIRRIQTIKVAMQHAWDSEANRAESDCRGMAQHAYR